MDLTMRDPERIDKVLAHLGEVWRRYPDWRLGQLVVNATPGRGDPFNVEDDEMDKGLRRLATRKERG